MPSNPRNLAPFLWRAQLPPIVERDLGERELTGAPSHRLVRWSLTHGADEFSLRVLALHETQAPFVDAFEDALAPYALPNGHRPTIDRDRLGSRQDASHRIGHETASVVSGSQDVRLWALTEASVRPLLSFCEDGILSWPVGPDGWFEDFTIYRAGALLLGVVSDERVGVLRVTPHELTTVMRDALSL